MPDLIYENIGEIGGVGGKFGGRQVVSSSCSTMYMRSRGTLNFQAKNVSTKLVVEVDFEYKFVLL